MNTLLSVIIPLAPRETAWHNLLSDLERLPFECEIILSAAVDRSSLENQLLDRLSATHAVRWIVGPQGRAVQMNAGAAAATGDFLWFLHADSRFAENTLVALQQAQTCESLGLHFFELSYDNDGHSPYWMNELGIRFRTFFFRVPFGDQGICCNRATFEQLGGFPEDVRAGEDHQFVWRALHQNLPVLSTGGSLYTSNRRHRGQGWLLTTCRHLILTAYQGFIPLIRFIARKLGLQPVTGALHRLLNIALLLPITVVISLFAVVVVSVALLLTCLAFLSGLLTRLGRSLFSRRAAAVS